MKSQNALENIQINVKLKLAALWTSFMFLYTYVDYFHFYMPGTLHDILKGKVFVFDISQTFLLIALIFVVIPVLMIFLSVVLPAKQMGQYPSCYAFHSLHVVQFSWRMLDAHATWCTR